MRIIIHVGGKLTEVCEYGELAKKNAPTKARALKSNEDLVSDAIRGYVC